MWSKFVQPYSGWYFRGCSRMEENKKALIPKICHLYLTMMKLDSYTLPVVIPPTKFYRVPQIILHMWPCDQGLVALAFL